MKKMLRHVFGWTFIVVGIIGLFLPFLQGILFIMAGIIILAPEIPCLHKIVAALEKRHPMTFLRARAFSRSSALCFRKKIASSSKDMMGDSDDRLHG